MVNINETEIISEISGLDKESQQEIFDTEATLGGQCPGTPLHQLFILLVRVTVHNVRQEDEVVISTQVILKSIAGKQVYPRR